MGLITEDELSEATRLGLVHYGGTTSGSGTAYTLDKPAISVLKEGMAVSFMAHVSSGASPTLNWSGTGAKSIDGVGAGDLEAGKIYTVRYTGSVFQLQSIMSKKSVSVSVTIAAANWSSGTYTISNAAITATNIVEMYTASGITDAQRDALRSADIVSSAQATGSITLKALGGAPTIDIPVNIVIRGDL